MAARLKVFTTSDGFTDYVVAVSSRPKALEAWGVKQDLFKEGVAREVDDPALVKAALAEPGKVLQRQAGTHAALAATKPSKAAKPKGPSKAALKRVAELEDRLTELQDSYRERLDGLDEERRALDAREEKIRAEQSAAEAALSARLDRARQALRD